MNRPILTKLEAEKLLKAQNIGHSVVKASFDLGITTQEVQIEGEFFLILGSKVPKSALSKLKEGTCYAFEEGVFKSIDFFGEDTNLFYKLVPTKDWPTIMLSSVPMHRFKTVSPKTSAGLMLSQIGPVRGKVLDTCGGLGYTAIGAAKDAEEVVVFENDENVVRIAKYNPFSRELFSNRKIVFHKKSVFEGVASLPSGYFDRIIHDPPTVSFAQDLYSIEFYKALFRVAKKGALLYHYCPNPGKTKGLVFFPTIQRNLEKAGFVNCKYVEKASGIKCEKK